MRPQKLVWSSPFLLHTKYNYPHFSDEVMEAQKPPTRGHASDGGLKIPSHLTVVSHLEHPEALSGLCLEGATGGPRLFPLAFPSGLSCFSELDLPLLQF